MSAFWLKGLATVALILAGVLEGQTWSWDNGDFDDRTGLLSLRGRWDETWVADDVICEEAVVIRKFSAQFYVSEPENLPFWLADLGIWEAPLPEGKPGDQILELRDLVIERLEIGQGHGYPIIEARVQGLNIELPTGSYYVSMRLVDDTNYYRTAWLATAGNGRINGYGAAWYWQGGDDRFWSEARYYIGFESDFAFRLEGELLNAIYAPDSVAIIKGSLRAGSLASLAADDDDYYVVAAQYDPGDPASFVVSMIWTDAHVQGSQYSSGRVKVVEKTNNRNSVFRIRAHRADGSFVALADNIEGSFQDVLIEAVLPPPISELIDAANGNRMRLELRNASSNRLAGFFQHFVDLAQWELTP
jgi:hypothetical protein